MDNSSHDSGAPLNWFITGAGSGLGRAITELALAEGDSAVEVVCKRSSLIRRSRGRSRSTLCRTDRADGSKPGS